MYSKYRMIWHQMEGQRLLYGAAIAALVLGSCFMYLVPLVPQVVMDGVLSGQPENASGFVQRAVERAGGREFLRDNLWIAGVAVLVLTIFAGLFTYLRGRWSALASEQIARKVRDQLYDQLQHLPLRYHDTAETGDLVQRCTSDVETLRQFLASQVVEIGRAAIMMVLPIPLMLALDVRMTMVSVIMVPPIVIFSILFFNRVRAKFTKVDEAEGAMTSTLQENLVGIRVVRAFARQEFEENKFAVRNRAHQQLDYGLFKLMGGYWSLSDLLCMGQLAIVLGFGGYWLANGQLQVGTFYFFLAAVNLFIWPVRMMGRILTNLGKATVAIGRIYDILGAERELDPDLQSRSMVDRIRAWAKARTDLAGESVEAVTAMVTRVPVGAGDLRASFLRPGDPAGAVGADIGLGIGAGGFGWAGPGVSGVVGSAVSGLSGSDADRPMNHGGVGAGFDLGPEERNPFEGSVVFDRVSFSHAPDTRVLTDASFEIRPGQTFALLGPSGSGKSTIVNLLLRLYDPDAGEIRLDRTSIGELPRKQVRSAISVVMQEPFLYSKTVRENIRLGRAGAEDHEVTDAASTACVHDAIEEFDDGYDTVVGERGVTLSGGQRQRVALARALLDNPAVLILDDALSAVDTDTEAMILDALRRRHGRQTTIVIAHRISTLMHADQILVLDQGRVVQQGTHRELIGVEGLYKRLWNIQSALEDTLKEDLESVGHAGSTAS